MPRTQPDHLPDVLGDILWLQLHIFRMLMSNQDSINDIAAQLAKAKGEILAEIAALEAQLAAGEYLDFSALRGAAQDLDDLNTDAPAA